MMRWEAVPVQEGHSCTEYLCMYLGNWLAEGYLSGSPATAPRSHDYPTHHAIAPAVHHHVLSINICFWRSHLLLAIICTGSESSHTVGIMVHTWSVDAV